MNIDKLKERLFELFPQTLLESIPDDEWGIHIPAGLSAISKVGCATSLSPWVIEDAKRCEVDFLVTHHDAWDFLYDMRTQCRDMLNASGIGHLFVHLPLDGSEFGCGASVLESVGCARVERFCEESRIYCGQIGELQRETDFGDFEAALTRELGEAPRFSWDSGAKVKRVAVVTGGGCNTDYVKDALELGCDTYVTGEYNLYLGMFARGQRINCLVYSHTATEAKGPENLANRLVDPGIPVVRLNEPRL
ncbi:MAG: Nif3-like dinuclear metal center hexameric protein [Armatimonadota bacterium]|nr:MAG: Nif3-like dinuclear metal center hexameric protein [Armatimonadota bacterium]